MVGIENFFSMKKIIHGFDFLKFFMATMVVLGHLKVLVELPNIDWYLPTIPLMLSIFIYCYRLNLPESQICKYLRNYSIILFFVQFFFIRFIFEPELLSFVVFYVASISIAMMIVYLSEKRHFKILNKLY